MIKTLTVFSQAHHYHLLVRGCVASVAVEYGLQTNRLDKRQERKVDRPPPGEFRLNQVYEMEFPFVPTSPSEK